MVKMLSHHNASANGKEKYTLQNTTAECVIAFRTSSWLGPERFQTPTENVHILLVEPWTGADTRGRVKHKPITTSLVIKLLVDVRGRKQWSRVVKAHWCVITTSIEWQRCISVERHGLPWSHHELWCIHIARLEQLHNHSQQTSALRNTEQNSENSN